MRDLVGLMRECATLPMIQRGFRGRAIQGALRDGAAEITSLRAALLAERQAGVRDAADHLKVLADAMYEKAQSIADAQSGGPFEPSTRSEADAAIMAYDFERAAKAVLSLIPTEDKQGSDGGGRDG